VRRLVIVIAALISILGPAATWAYDVPLAGSPYYLQTSGPTAGIGIGDWYTDTAGGGGAGNHYYGIIVPCTWPAATPIQIDIFSPELHTAGSVIDELRTGALNTVFEIYAPGTVVPAPPPFNVPLPGAAGSLRQTTYTPVATADNYVRFYTIAAPVACGAYILRTATQGDDDNGWRLRVGSDNDANPNNAPPAASDPGIAVTQIYGTFQHDGPNPTCISLYEFIAAAGTTTFHNFDIDGNTSVTYFPPNGSPVSGTVSNNATWNNSGTTNRVGDVVPVAANQVGYWRIETCASNANQFIQEGSTPLGAFFSLPLGSTVAKTDGVTTAQFGGYLQYTITFTNNSIPTGAVAANVVIRDTIPTNTTFDSASVVAPFTGACSFSAGVVTCNVVENVAAGASGSVTVTVLVNDPAAGATVVNNATLDYTDVLGARYPQERTSDTDQLPSLKLVKTSANPGDTGDGPQVGDVITYTLTLSNPTATTQTSVVINDPVPAGTTYVANSTVASGFAQTKTFADNFSSASYARQDGTDNWSANWLEGNEGDGPSAGDIRVESGYMRISANNKSLSRTANLAITGGAGCAATLNFDRRRNSLDNVNDSVTVSISGDGGASFTTLATFAGPTNDGAFVAESFNVTAFATANTLVRFQSSATLGGGDEVRFDNVQLQNTCSGGVKDNIAGGANPDLVSGVPPTLVQAADALSIAPGASITVTFRVTVTTAGPIENIATATSAQDPDPAEGRVRDVALTRASLAGLRIGGGVVEFATSWQRGTAGFNLYSAPSRLRRADKTRINGEFIKSPRPESMTPILYRVDAQVQGPYLWIEEVELGSEDGRLMGPFAVDDDSMRRQFERVELRLAGAPRDERSGSRSIRSHTRVRGKGVKKVFRGSPRAAATGVKVEVAEAGTVQLSWSDLAGQGLPQRFVRDTRNLRLTNLGRNVAFSSDASGLSFVSKDLVTQSTSHNVYILTWNGTPALTAPPVRSEPAVETGQYRVQKNWIYYGLAPKGSDPWLWDVLAPGDPWPVDWDPTQGDFDLPGYVPSSSSVSVRIAFLGRTEGEHQLEAFINGTPVGGLTFSGATLAVLEGSIPAATLRAKANNLSLRYTSEGAPDGFVYLNYMDLGLTLPARAAVVERLSSFDPTLPRLSRADYLIVTHPDFQAQAEQIASLKNGAGRSAVVVDVERAYDAFTGGVPDEGAIKALIAAAGRASTALLIGDDTLDPADNYDLGERVFVPSAVGFDPFTGRVASENLYADRNNDGAPDLAIGRLAVRTAAEADIMVAKIANSQSLLAQNLGRHIIAVDNQGLNDMAFRGEGRRIEAMLNEPTAFADISLGAAEARDTLLAALTAGAITTTYVGHGAPDHWADEGIFGSEDAALFTNANQGTLLLTWACVSSDYRYFFGSSVSEAMTLTPMGGAVASFGPTGLSLPTLQRELYLRLYPKLLAGLSLGEAVKETKAEMLATHPGEREFLHGWVLLGDPDVTLPR
jgi:uncharacterized repeat protein (TIGR01451 family)